MHTKTKDIIAWLNAHGTQSERNKLARYGIPAENAVGISVGDLKKKAKVIGPDHALTAELWNTKIYEARMLAAYVDVPAQVTSKQMDQWASDFDSWSICDAVCFALFDECARAWTKVATWPNAKAEYKKRAAFALLWSLSVHDKQATDAKFKEGLALIERFADDERLYVKKGIDMSLRAVGKRNAALNKAAIKTALTLSRSDSAPASWIGKHALSELQSDKVRAMLARKR